jgi:hypothetical protein
MATEKKTTKYIIEPNYKKSTYQTEEWVNKLKNGKPVIIHVTSFYRWGTFEISLTEEEKNEILKKESIEFDDYEEFEMHEMWDGCDLYVEIQNEENFTNQEIKEIKCLIYCNQEDKECKYQNNSESESESKSQEESESENECEYNNVYDECVMCDNGWEEWDTSYGFSTGCVLKPYEE